MTAGEPNAYVHGVGESEQARLSRLNELINPPMIDLLAPAPGAHVLDMGSGLGQFTSLIASRVGSRGRVVGLERDEAQLAKARHAHERAGSPAHLEFRRGDALDPPLASEEIGGFDIAHTRFLLEHLSRPEEAVRRIVEAVKPGGRIALADDDHAMLHLWPEAPEVMRLWDAYMALYERFDSDPCIGRRLPSLLAGAGALPRRAVTVPFGTCQGDPAFTTIVENHLEILDGARAAIVEADLMAERDVLNSLDALRDWSGAPGAAFWYVVCWAEGVRPDDRG